MKHFKTKRGSILVEKILMAAFAVAAGGAVVVYGSKVITNAKNTEITGILSGNGQMSQEELDAHFNDSSKQITLTASELNSKSFPNLVSFVLNQDVLTERCPDFWTGHNSSSIVYNGETYLSDEVCCWEENGKIIGYIAYAGECVPSQNKDFYITIGRNTLDDGRLEAGGIMFESLLPNQRFENFTSNLTWNIPHEQYYQFIKTLLISDLS